MRYVRTNEKAGVVVVVAGEEDAEEVWMMAEHLVGGTVDGVVAAVG